MGGLQPVKASLLELLLSGKAMPEQYLGLAFLLFIIGLGLIKTAENAIKKYNKRERGGE